MLTYQPDIGSKQQLGELLEYLALRLFLQEGFLLLATVEAVKKLVSSAPEAPPLLRSSAFAPNGPKADPNKPSNKLNSLAEFSLLIASAIWFLM